MLSEPLERSSVMISFRVMMIALLPKYKTKIVSDSESPDGSLCFRRTGWL
jgi:hypothetical protein